MISFLGARIKIYTHSLLEFIRSLYIYISLHIGRSLQLRFVPNSFWLGSIRECVLTLCFKIIRLGECSPQLEKLIARRCGWITRAGINSLSNGCHKLVHLDLRGCLNITYDFGEFLLKGIFDIDSSCIRIVFEREWWSWRFLWKWWNQ